jgi:hypothetical protein
VLAGVVCGADQEGAAISLGSFRQKQVVLAEIGGIGVLAGGDWR